MLQLQHHQPNCHRPSQSHNILLPDSSSSNTSKSLFLSELQSENSLELAFHNTQFLQPHLFGVAVSPVTSAAHLLDTHLHISSNLSPVASVFSQPSSFTVQPLSYDTVTLQHHGDCEMEDLTSNQMGKFVLVKWDFFPCSPDHHLQERVVGTLLKPANKRFYFAKGDIRSNNMFEICAEAIHMKKLISL